MKNYLKILKEGVETCFGTKSKKPRPVSRLLHITAEFLPFRLVAAFGAMRRRNQIDFRRGIVWRLTLGVGINKQTDTNGKPPSGKCSDVFFPNDQ